MPKSSPSQDSTKSPIDEQTRANDIALRKKKNAEAQAAFRARRTNYIGTLEETGEDFSRRIFRRCRVDRAH